MYKIARMNALSLGFRAVTSALSLYILLGNQVASADAPAAATAAVTYLEHPEDGDFKGQGRKLSTTGRAYYGIDINSVLDVTVDRPGLEAALLASAGKTQVTERARALTARLTLLGNAAEGLKSEAEKVQQLFAVWKSLQDAKLVEKLAAVDKRELIDGKEAEFRAKLVESANGRRLIMNALYDVRRQRLRGSGKAQAVADKEAKTAFVPVLSGTKLEFGYDWKAWGALFNEELQFAHDELEKITPDLGLKMEIRAHLVPKSGGPIAVFLPGYNHASAGAESRYEKLKFAVPDNEKQLYEEYEKTAKKIGEAKDAGDAVVKLLEAQYAELRTSLKEVTSAAKRAFDDSRDKLRKLQSWSSAEKRRTWLETLKSDLKQTNEGNSVLEAWGNLEEIFNDVQEDIDAIEAYSKLDESLSSQSPLDAMDTILKALDAIRSRDPRTAGIRVLRKDVWETRLRKVDDFVTKVKALTAPLLDEIKKADGPYADLIAARESLQSFQAALKSDAAKVAEWIGEVVFSLPTQRAAADLPVAPDQRQLPVFGSEQLGTSVNLLTVPAQRQVGDTLRIQYRFLDGATELDSGWTDTFVLQSYGWQSEVLASLVFTKQSGEPTWQPNAAINWILSKNAWPKEEESGLVSGTGIKWFSGAGISAMPLNSSNSNGIQMGLGATLAFLNNRVFVGYGANLQAEHNKGFWFFSIRLLTFPGLSGPLSGTTSGK